MVIKTYWWNSIPNFGDRLTPLLLARFTGHESEWAPISQARLIGVGSVIEHIPESWYGFIFGSGKLHEESTLKGAKLKRIMALRGPLTAKGIKGNFVLGDPGLLANELVQVETKKYKLGIVPHWSDTTLALNPIFAQYRPKVIDPRSDPLRVIKDIGECEKIVASSLHGIILADAFGIPRRFEYTKRFDDEGGTFKFLDYSAAIGARFEPGKTMTPSWNRIQDVKHELFDTFLELTTLLP